MSTLLSAIQTLVPIGPALEAALAAVVRREEVPARQLLLQPGQVAQRLYFIEQGLARGYALHAGQDVSSWFMHEGDFVISIVSFLTQQPSTEYIELLEPSVLHAISYQHLQELYRAFPEFNYVGRVLTERYYVQSEQRAYQLRTLPAKERYAQLLADFPNLGQRVPQKYLASYLGISPETLSRLRARRN
jgi:CRP-like cAMP-binding protein